MSQATQFQEQLHPFGGLPFRPHDSCRISGITFVDRNLYLKLVYAICMFFASAVSHDYKKRYTWLGAKCPLAEKRYKRLGAKCPLAEKRYKRLGAKCPLTEKRYT